MRFDLLPMLKLVLFASLCFCAIYNIKVSFIPVPMGFVLWPACALFLFWRRPLRFFTEALQAGAVLPMFWIAFLVTYSVCVSILRGNGYDFTIPYNFMIWGLLFIPEGFVLAEGQKSVRAVPNRGTDLYTLIVTVMVIQSACIYISFFSIGFREIGSSILGDLSGGTLDLGGTRVKGFTNGGGAWLSLLQGVGAAMSYKLFTEKGKWIYLVSSVFITGSTFFTGRTGLLFMALFLVMYLPYCIFARKIKWSHIGLIAGVLAVLSPVIYKQYVDDTTKMLIEDYVVKRSLDVFDTSFSAEGFKHHSFVEDIADQYSIPDTTLGFLFGDGLYLSDGVDYAGDPGYVKYLFYFGIFGCISYYLYFVLLMFQTIRCSETIAEKYFIALFYLLFFLMETKEPFFAKTNVIHHLLYFHAVLSADSRRRQSKPVVFFGHTGQIAPSVRSI